MSAATTLARTCRAEWSRIWTVRSSWVFAVVTTVAVVGLGAIIGNDLAGEPETIPADATAWDAGRFTAMFALFGILALAAVTATADNGTGGIVPSLQWTPRRPLLLSSRAAVIASTSTVLAMVLVGFASAAVRASVPQVGLPIGAGIEVLGGLAIVFSTGALLAVGIGFLTRSTAATLVAVIALVLVLPLLLAQLPYDWTTTLSARMPGSGALFLIFGEGPDDDMTITTARLTLAAWAVLAMTAGGWRLLRSDADR